MRRAQALLDETQAERSRTLAAFAVTVGDDGSIADLMGLKEREVRLARRAVGRSNARSLAAELLSQVPHASRNSQALQGPQVSQHPVHPQAPQNPVPPQSPQNLVNKPFASSDAPAPAPQPGDESPSSPPPLPQQQPYAPDAMVQEPPDVMAPGPVTAQEPPPAPEPAATPESVPPSEPVAVPQAPELVPAVFQTPAPFPSASPEPVYPVAWSPSMDSVLLWSWESGLDLQTVAGELGLDVRTLLMRVQELADDGLIVLAAPVAEVNRSGRHRRHEEGYAGLFGPTTTFPAHVPY
ncbi:hypothetical protein ACFYZN_02990 [Streptomyces sp. NPDC001777]|uniref:hypothetical protein n=1 Tax=Streptomyces sp. NPDC001777 TaxID=3364608 RepID=UPI0036CA4D1E